MLTSFSVKNYRGFRDLTIDRLTRINLVAGMNNTGKTSLLEAMQFLVEPSENIVLRTSQSRGDFDLRSHFPELARWLFPSGQATGSLEFSATFNERPPRGLQAYLRDRLEKGTGQQSLFQDANSEKALGSRRSTLVVTGRDGDMDSSYFIDSRGLVNASFTGIMLPISNRFVTRNGDSPQLIEDFSRVKIEQRLSEFLPALQYAEPRLLGLELAGLGGESEIYASIGLVQLLPLPMMGEGIRRILAFVLSIANCPSGIVFIDEIENGIHHSIMGKVWNAIGEAARRANCQVVATTHSYECIQAAQQAFADNGEDDLTLIRLERVGDSIEPVVITEEAAGNGDRAQLGDPLMAGSLDQPCLIIGEGKDELECFESLVNFLGLTGIQVDEYGGKQELPNYLRDLPARKGFRNLRALCVTRDVDHDGEDFYCSVQSILASISGAIATWGIPPVHDFESIIEDKDGRRVGVFLMPGQGRDGALEDLCIEALSDDPARPCIDSFLECLQGCGTPQPKLKTMQSKARIHAWLASRETADLARLGLASKSKFNYIPWQHPAFDPLKNFLRDLFDVAPQP